MKVRAANIFLIAGLVIMVFAMWLQYSRKSVTGYTGPGVADAPANRIDTFGGWGLFLLAIGCFYCGWTLIRKKEK